MSHKMSLEGHRGRWAWAQVTDPSRLHKARRNAGFSLKAACGAVGQPGAYTYLGRLERGKARTCSVPFALSLAYTYQVDAHALFRVCTESRRGVA